MAPPGGTDPATTAWIAAVLAVDGSIVSPTSAGKVNTLITGMKTAANGNLFTAMDRLWLFAIESSTGGIGQTEALVDIISGSLATNVNNTTFTANRGFTGNGSNMYIDSNFNATTAPSPKFVQDSACLFAWSNTTVGAGVDGGGLVGLSGSISTFLQPHYSDNNFYWGLNAFLGAFAGSGATGLFLENRDGHASTQADLNGGNLATGPTAANAPFNESFKAFISSGNINGIYQICCFGFGAGLTAGNRTDFYTLMRAYMNSVGVP